MLLNEGHEARGEGGPDEGWLRGWVERLAVPRHFTAQGAMNRRVGGVLGQAFEALGLRVDEQGPYRNVVARPRGASGPLTLVAAHFDSVPGSPGADDNASGVAAMLAVAQALSGRGLAVGFVAFNAEEDGLLGSRDFVARGRDELGVEVARVHVLEMVGYRARGEGSQRSPLPRLLPSLGPGDFVGLVGNAAARAEVSAALGARPAPRRLGLTVWGGLVRMLPDLGRGDHWPFWEAGLPAVLWTDTAEFRNPHYHRVSDRPDTLDYGFLRQTSALLASVTMGRASPALARYACAPARAAMSRGAGHRTGVWPHDVRRVHRLPRKVFGENFWRPMSGCIGSTKHRSRFSQQRTR